MNWDQIWCKRPPQSVLSSYHHCLRPINIIATPRTRWILPWRHNTAPQWLNREQERERNSSAPMMMFRLHRKYLLTLLNSIWLIHPCQADYKIVTFSLFSLQRTPEKERNKMPIQQRKLGSILTVLNISLPKVWIKSKDHIFNRHETNQQLPSMLQSSTSGLR